MLVTHGRISHPDSAGMAFTFANTSVREADPPFEFANVSGKLRQLGDSMWVEAAHWDLPASTATPKARSCGAAICPCATTCTSGRLCVAPRRGVGLSDARRERGAARSVLDIKTEQQPARHRLRPHVDGRAQHRSRLLDGMTFETARTLLSCTTCSIAGRSGGLRPAAHAERQAVSVRLAGDITGTVKASGGTTRRFIVDDGGRQRSRMRTCRARIGQVSGKRRAEHPAPRVHGVPRIRGQRRDLRPAHAPVSQQGIPAAQRHDLRYRGTRLVVARRSVP